MSAFPNPSHEPNTAEVLRKILSFGFSLLSPNDQQDKIERISKKLAAGVADVERLEGETEEDLRRKQFAELLNKAPVHTQVYLFWEFTNKFNREKCLCEAILLFRQLDSNEQQGRLEEMLDQLSWTEREELKDVILERLSEECEEDFRLRRFIKLCSRYNGLLYNFISNEAKDWDLESLHMQKSGKEEIEFIKQSRYAEYYLGLSIIWFKARWASDPKGLIHLIISKFEEGDHIIEKLVNETEEDFRLRRFKESFKQLQFSTQEDVVKRIQDDLETQVFAFDFMKESSEIGFSGVPAVEFLFEMPVANYYQEPDKEFANDFMESVEFLLGMPEANYFQEPDKEFANDFMRVRTPNLRGSGGTAATQGGGQGAITQGGQGAITQGGQGTSQQ